MAVCEQCACEDLLNSFTYFLGLLEIVHSKEEGERGRDRDRNKRLSFKSFVIRQMTQNIQDCSKKSDFRMLDLSKINLGIISSILQ